MNFLDLAKKRYSVRKFDTRTVEQEKVNLILEAGKVAPTANNYQPQRIYILSSKKSLYKLESCTPYHFHAPLAFLICFDNSKSWKRTFDNTDMGLVDASIVITHMMLQITNLGLGTTWVAHFDPQKIKSMYSLPNNIVPVAILPVGYPAESSKPHSNHNKRLELSQTIFYDND